MHGSARLERETGGGWARRPPKGRGEHRPRRLAGGSLWTAGRGWPLRHHHAETGRALGSASCAHRILAAAVGRGEVTCSGPPSNHWAQILTKRNHVFYEGRSLMPVSRVAERLIPVLSCRKGTSGFPLGLEKPETGGSHTSSKPRSQQSASRTLRAWHRQNTAPAELGRPRTSRRADAPCDTVRSSWKARIQVPARGASLH